MNPPRNVAKKRIRIYFSVTIELVASGTPKQIGNHTVAAETVVAALFEKRCRRKLAIVAWLPLFTDRV
jgi:hypothetical protein